MELEDETKTPYNRQVVNRCISLSFGRGFRGDYHPVFGGDFGDWSDIEVKKNLHLIARRGLIRTVIAGQFLNGEGSRLSILPEYLKRAKEYARLYEGSMRKEVSVIIDEEADEVRVV